MLVEEVITKDGMEFVLVLTKAFGLSFLLQVFLVRLSRRDSPLILYTSACECIACCYKVKKKSP